MSFLVRLNEAQTTTRYPDNLDNLHRNYSPAAVDTILQRSKEYLQWIRRKYSES